MRFKAMGAAVCLTALAFTSNVAWGAPSAPTASEIIETASIRGVPAEAVIYRQNGIKLGAVIREHGVQMLVWSRQLAEVPAHLTSPGPSGLLQGVLRSAGNPQAKIFAYIVHSSGVTSAIAGHPSGIVSGSEGANFHGLSFTLKDPDASHIGSVKYRFETTYTWNKNSYSTKSRIRIPDYTSSAYPSPNATATTKSGDIVLIRLEIADTEISRNTGLMNRTSLDPDSGMIFVWPQPVLESFWMENTYIPLSIAFLSPKGTVQEIQNMAPLTTTFHTPALPYQYAIEANLGYFKSVGISPGDTLSLHLPS